MGLRVVSRAKGGVGGKQAGMCGNWHLQLQSMHKKMRNQMVSESKVAKLGVHDA